MKKLLLGFFITSLSLAVMGQNMFQNGNMEEQGAWEVLSLQNSGGDIDVQFGVTITPPMGGSGNCMEATLVHLDLEGTAQVLVYQVLDLVGGEKYKFRGYLKDIYSTPPPDTLIMENTWVEVMWIDTAELPELNAGDIDGNQFSGINCWNLCGPLFDGNIPDSACQGSPDTVINGFAYFTMVDSLGDSSIVGLEVPVAVGFTIGMWANSPLEFDLLFDEFFFGDSAATTDGIKPVEQAMMRFYIYPNPANRKATIHYELARSANVTLTVYNILGSRVAILVNEHKETGVYRADLDVSKLPNGAYFCKLQVDNKVFTSRFTIIK